MQQRKAPYQYLLARKLQAIRQDLGRGVSTGATVIEIALKYRLDHLGRFSQRYRRMFEETPSQTLRHGPTRRDSSLTTP